MIQTLARLCIVLAVSLLSACGASQSTAVMPSQQSFRLGTPFRIAGQSVLPTSSFYKVLYSFAGGSDGAEPNAGLINVNGTLYGTTSSGGAHSNGTVFSITKGGVEKVLYSFGGYPIDGARPNAELIDVNGALYGTTSYGGATDSGTVFRISKRGIEKVLYNFGGYPTDGANPNAELVDVNGKLYGTTTNGGPWNSGTVYSSSTTGAEKVLYSFNYYDGGGPYAGLINVKGTLYGTTAGGGLVYGCCGTIFSRTGGYEKVLYAFGLNRDGAFPAARLLDVKGSFYGTTYYGGLGPCNSGCGTVFRFTNRGTETLLYSFNGQPYDGAYPRAGLINVRGTLYGTTSAGGNVTCPLESASRFASGCGTIYSITPAGTERVLHIFARGDDGSNPAASLIELNGALYGTTSSGGNYNNGTVFVLTP